MAVQGGMGQSPENFTLPFKVELDLQQSDLSPGPGKNQRFCYRVTGVGEDAASNRDLSGWVLEISEQITTDQIQNIQVYIDGEKQAVTFGEDGNVKLLPFGSGLQFSFPLSKIQGAKNSTGLFCFELIEPCPLYATAVCFLGGDKTARGLTVVGPQTSGVTIFSSKAKIKAINFNPIENKDVFSGKTTPNEQVDRASIWQLSLNCPPGPFTVGDFPMSDCMITYEGETPVYDCKLVCVLTVPGGVNTGFEEGPFTRPIVSITCDLKPGGHVGVGIGFLIVRVDQPDYILIEYIFSVTGGELFREVCRLAVLPLPTRGIKLTFPLAGV